LNQIRSNPRTGVVYTRRELVQFALDLARYAPTRDLARIRVLDVGCGYGQFVGEVARRLAVSCKRSGVPIARTLRIVDQNIRGVEVNRRTALQASEAVLTTIAQVYREDLRTARTDPICALTGHLAC
jgi:SAM-dependent methyltransferase